MDIHNRIPGTNTALELLKIYESTGKDGKAVPKPHYNMRPSRPPQKGERASWHIDDDYARTIAYSTGPLPQPGLGN